MDVTSKNSPLSLGTEKIGKLLIIAAIIASSAHH